jgi:hypothetical protein
VPPTLPRPDAPLASHAPASGELGADHVQLWVRASEACDGRFELAGGRGISC